MAVTDRARALDYLERIGYYRLSGYWFAFRKRSEPLCLLYEHGHKPKKVREERIALDAFRAGTTFQNAVGLYVFDKQLRLLVMDALERIEVALRVDVSHTLPTQGVSSSALWKALHKADKPASRSFLGVSAVRVATNVQLPKSSTQISTTGRSEPRAWSGAPADATC